MTRNNRILIVDNDSGDRYSYYAILSPTQKEDIGTVD